MWKFYSLGDHSLVSCDHQYHLDNIDGSLHCRLFNTDAGKEPFIKMHLCSNCSNVEI